ncbi:MAG: ROK family protein [Gemmatimonadota bacterium]
MRYILGVDIGGTNLVVGAVAEDGSALIGLRSESTGAAHGPDAVIERIVGMAKRTIADTVQAVPNAEITGVGVGCPGPLNIATGIVVLTPNLGWVNMPVRDRIESALERPTAIDNDANCAMAGEWWIGAAKGARHALTVTLGTGIGGGIVIDGKLFHGASDVAGEVGHMTIETNGRRCGCGNDGCLEAYASGPAIAQRTIEALEAGADSSIRTLVGDDLTTITAQIVYDAAAANDPLALEVVRDTAKYLGTGVANLINLLNPEVVVICGGVTLAGDRLFKPLRREVNRRAFRPAVDACRIVPGLLPGTAGVYGAAKAFLEQEGSRRA